MADEKTGQAIPFNLGKLLTQAASVAGVTLGAEALYGWGKKALGAMNFSGQYRRMLAANPTLRNEDAQKVMDRFRVLSRFGPTIAEDPIVAGHWIKQTLEFPVVSPTVLKEVVDVESRAKELSGFGPARGVVGKNIGEHLSKGLSGQGEDWLFKNEEDRNRR